MILYLIRHAIAADPVNGDDHGRPLTAEGKEKWQRAVKGFLALEPEVRHVVSSPLLRARQTAEILVEMLADEKTAAEIATDDALGASPDLKRFLRTIAKFKGNVAAVGHEPTLSAWVGELCFDAAGRCEMKKGAIAAIEMGGRGMGRLLWILQPGQLRAIGK